MEENETKAETTKDAANTAAVEDDENALYNHKLESLQADMRKMQNEFNAQRAKMREIYMQKESECAQSLMQRKKLQDDLDELKTKYTVVVSDLESQNKLQDLKAQEEITSLQQMVQDTIEESAMYKLEFERLKEQSTRYRQQQLEIQQQQQQQHQPPEPSGIAPHVLNQVKKTLGTVRKLGSESLGASFQQESAENNGKPYVSEDAEMLHSIVEQLQEEMNALKEKLRETDEKLQAKNVTATCNDDDTINKSTSTDLLDTSCEGCLQAEEKHKEIIAQSKQLQKQADSLQKQLVESRESICKEAALRKDLEDQWQEKREAHKSEVQKLREQVKTNEQQLLDMQQKFLETRDDVMRKLQSVSDDRERVNKQLETLQADNDFLSGLYLATSEEIENQYINLPNNVVELQELMLRQQSELIQARVSSEYEKQKCVSSLDEIQLLRAQLEESNNERRAYKRKMQSDTKSLQDRLTEHLLTVQKCEAAKTQLERKEAELNRQVTECRVEIIELQEKNEKLSKLNSEYKSQIKTLQEELSTMETVQKDFVKLSQTLQISLEKLRHADTEVRWQDDEDIDNCPTCKTNFTVTVRKIHCRHCGHIYCDKCLSKTVPSGPRKRVARVCDVCHTLLTPNTAPYFSRESKVPSS